MRFAVLITAVAGLAAPAGALAETGSQVWSQAGCGGCHTLAAAGAYGDAGPNLDQLQPSSDRVARQVTYGGPGMPSFGSSLSTAQIDALASYVAAAAGGGSAPAPQSTGAASLPPPAAWVKRLQKKLARLGFFKHAVTGIYGPVMTAAVRRFQASAGIRADGKWGPQSQAALVKALGR